MLGEQLEKERSRDGYQKGLITSDVNLAFALALKDGTGVENQLYLVIKQEWSLGSFSFHPCQILQINNLAME